jgi:hypothetical protein
MKTKRGRPKVAKSDYKGVLFAVRVAKPEAEQIQVAIKRSGLSKPDWHRQVLLNAAK